MKMGKNFLIRRVLIALLALPIRPFARMLRYYGERVVWPRRRQAIVQALRALLDRAGRHGGGPRILDIGCGDGFLARDLAVEVPGIEIIGIDSHVWPRGARPAALGDGLNLPFRDGAFDGALLIDVIHHTRNPGRVLAEADRVSRRFVLVKDHYYETALDRWLLAAMDWAGGMAVGMDLPFSYLRWEELSSICKELGLSITNADLKFSPKGITTLIRLKHVLMLLEKDEASIHVP